jgi:hypothetical protein
MSLLLSYNNRFIERHTVSNVTSVLSAKTARTSRNMLVVGTLRLIGSNSNTVFSSVASAIG